MPKKKSVTVAEAGRKGGKARVQKLSKEQLKNWGREAAKKRWGATEASQRSSKKGGAHGR